MKKSVTIAIAIAGLFPFVSSTQALEMRGQSSLQLRQGPGHHYATTGQIASGQMVKIGVCNPSWCHVRLGNNAGWVPTAHINPNLARMAGQTSRHSAAASSAGRGGSAGSSSVGGQMQAATSMRISLEIVAKDTTKGTMGTKSRANTLPYPVPAHRQIQTR